MYEYARYFLRYEKRCVVKVLVCLSWQMSSLFFTRIIYVRSLYLK